MAAGIYSDLNRPSGSGATQPLSNPGAPDVAGHGPGSVDG